MATIGEKEISDAECACILLRGAVERMMIIMRHRAENVYGTAIESVEQTIADWRDAAAKLKDAPEKD